MRRITLLLSISLGATAALALGLWNELREERVRTAALSEQLAARHDVAIPAPAPAPPVSAPAVTPVAVSPAAAAPAVNQTPNRVSGTQQEWQEVHRRLLRDPKYRAASADKMRLQYAKMREDAISLLGFTPAEADAVIDMLVERQMRSREQPDNSVVDSSPEGLRQLKAANEAGELAWRQQIRERIGAQKQESWQRYTDSLGSRSRVDQLRVQLTGADALRDDQIEPLVSALHAERSKMREEIEQAQESMPWQSDNVEAQAQYHQRKIDAMRAAHERIHDAASAILASRQLDRLDALLRVELERQETLQRLANAARKVEAAEAPTD
jgi:hypothetical protein